MVFLKMSLLQQTKLSTAGDKSVFKSLAVDSNSKTPYSDATQVGRSPCSLHAFVRVEVMPLGPLFCFPCLICQRGAA